MRRCLQVSGSTLPSFTLSGVESQMLSAKMEEWNRSDYAGFRRLLEAGSDCHPDLMKIRALAAAHGKGSTGKTIRDFVVLGIGGSSLGAEATVRALHPTLREPRFHVADNSDPTVFRWLLDGLRASETLFYVIAKSAGNPLAVPGGARMAPKGHGGRRLEKTFRALHGSREGRPPDARQALAARRARGSIGCGRALHRAHARRSLPRLLRRPPDR